MIVTRRRWKCDACGTEVGIKSDAASPPLPKDWIYHDHGYGNTSEVCSDPDCQEWLRRLANGDPVYEPEWSDA